MAGRIVCLSIALLVVSVQLGSVFSDGNFVASVASSSSGPQGGHVFTATYPGPGGKPQIQGNTWPGPDGSFSLDNRNGPAEASASANGGKGFPNNKPLRPNSSSGASAQSINALPSGNSGVLPDKSLGSGVKVQTSPNSVSVSSSASASSGVDSIGIRGSFGGDDESVQIEVNGQKVAVPKGTGAPAAAPSYSSPGLNNAISYSDARLGGPMNQNPFGGMNPQDFFNQYFAAMRAQQEAFQRQMQAIMFQHQNAILNNQWMWNNQINYENGFPNPHYNNRFPNYFSNPYVPPMNYASAYGGDFAAGLPYTGGVPYGQQSFSSGNAVASASAGASVGPNGGFQHAQIAPARPGIESRFGEPVPPPSGGSYGVFSSSSSSSSLGPDGKPITHKEATVGVNDNGKVSVHTVHDP